MEKKQEAPNKRPTTKNNKPKSWKRKCGACLCYVLFVLVLLVACVLGWLVQTTVQPNSKDIPQTFEFLADGHLLAGSEVKKLKIGMLAWGSRGDVQPFLNIGKELTRRGHTVTIATRDKFRDAVLTSGCNFVWSASESLDEITDLLSGEKLELSSLVEFCWLTSNSTLHESLDPWIKLGQESDLIIGQCLPFVLDMHLQIAEHVKKPIIFLTHDPLLPSAELSFDVSSLSVGDHGMIANVLNHRSFSIVAGMGTLDLANKLRTKLGNAKVYYYEQYYPPLMKNLFMLYTYTPSVWGPPPSDFSPFWISTGFLFNDDSKNYLPPPGLEDFIHNEKQQGRKLAYIGMGSNPSFNSSMITKVISNLTKSSHWSVVTLSSSIDPLQLETGSHVFYSNELAHDWLFPQMDVNVHHGGAGTASAVLLAGKPGICIPVLAVQQCWGEKIHSVGAGFFLTRQELSTELLLSTLENCLRDDVVKKAAEISLSMRSEGGAKNAVDILMETLEKYSRPNLLSPENNQS